MKFTAILSLTFALIMLAGCNPANKDTAKDDEAKSGEKTSDQGEQLAQVGVGKRGSASRQHKSGIGKIIAQPAVQFFNAKENIAFNIQIPKAMQLNKALSGREIKSHEQFMDKIIKANHIQLPELPEGRVYEFRPQDQKLYVVPAKPAT